MGGRGASIGIKDFTDWLAGETKGGTVKEIDINQYSDWRLEEVENRIRGLKHEELFVFDAYDRVLEAYKGGKSDVSFPAYLYDIEDATVTHGHPKGFAEFGGTFSFADVGNMAKSKWKEHRVAASGQGEYNYIIRRTSHSDGEGLYRRVNKDLRRMKAAYESSYKKEYKAALKSGKTKKQAKHLARQKVTGDINNYWSKVLPEYGFEYIKRKTTYKYNR